MPQSIKTKTSVADMQEKIQIVKDYLTEVGFKPDLYFLKDSVDVIEVDFDLGSAVFYIMEDFKKTQYKELFNIDYKKTTNSRRHTAIFSFGW